MATRIVFAAARGEHSLSVDVEEDVNGVFDAWTAAKNLPFPLTLSTGEDQKVWINPATVAYWLEAPGDTPVVSY
jgi:hypothetical protein